MRPILMLSRIASLARTLSLPLFLFVVAESAYLVYPMVRRKALGLERSEALEGMQVAMRAGCFGCHGDGGHGKVGNLGGRDDVPGFRGGMVTMYTAGQGAARDAEIREWIADGMPKRLAADADFQESRKGNTLRMPAFRGKLADREIDLLVTYVKTVGNVVAPANDTSESAGFDVAFKAGCFGCHGPMGMGGVGNVGSFKGYVPGWWGHDFRELVTSEPELREWLEMGSIRRLREHPIGGIFVRRQVISMPAFKERLTPEEIDAVMAYVKWVNHTAGKGDPAR